MALYVGSNVILVDTVYIFIRVILETFEGHLKANTLVCSQSTQGFNPHYIIAYKIVQVGKTLYLLLNVATEMRRMDQKIAH